MKGTLKVQKSGNNHKTKIIIMHVFLHTFNLKLMVVTHIIRRNRKYCTCLLSIRAYHIVGLICEMLSAKVFFFLSFIYYPNDNHYYNPKCSQIAIRYNSLEKHTLKFYLIFIFLLIFPDISSISCNSPLF